MKPHHVEQIVMLKAATAPFAAVDLQKDAAPSVQACGPFRAGSSHNPAADTEPSRRRRLAAFTIGPISRLSNTARAGRSAASERLALELALNTTARRGDMVKLGRQHECAATPGAPHGRLEVAHSKNKSPVIVPILPELRVATCRARSTQASLSVTHDRLNHLLTERGKPYHVNSLGDEFRKWANAADLPQCSIHGLRKSGARRLAEAGASAKEIMAVTGHRTLSEVQRYVDAADQHKLAEQGMAKLSKRGRDSA